MYVSLSFYFWGYFILGYIQCFLSIPGVERGPDAHLVCDVFSFYFLGSGSGPTSRG